MKFRYSAPLALILLGLCCCTSEEVDMTKLYVTSELLDVATNEITISGDGENGTIQIKANCEWEIRHTAKWSTLSSNSGSNNKDIIFSCTSNPSGESVRKDTLTISSRNSELQTTCVVTQSASAESLKIEIDDATAFPATGGTRTLTVSSNVSWKVRDLESHESWIHLSRTAGNGGTEKVTITAESNPDAQTRNATIIVIGQNMQQRLLLTQEAKRLTFSVSPTNISASAVGNDYELHIEGDTPWDAQIKDDWCKLDVR